MKTYMLEQIQRETTYYTVDAETEEEAMELLMSGEVDPDGSEYLDSEYPVCLGEKPLQEARITTKGE